MRGGPPPEGSRGPACRPLVCYIAPMTVREEVHARYLDYRERFTYFGRNVAMLSQAAFEAADAEHAALSAATERTDEEDARLVELTLLLYRD